LQEPDAALVEKLNLLEGSYLKRAAILLFHATPQRWFIGASVKIGYFRSDTDLVYHDQIEGDLFTQSQRTVEVLLAKYLKAVISYEGLQRVETLPVPEAALREALLNALIHRDYAVGAPIQIRVYDDRLHIWNPGELPEHWSVERLLQMHPSRPFNPAIANAFFRAGEIEAWGRGIQRIFDACRQAGMPPPRLDYTAGDWSMEFRFSASYQAALSPAEVTGQVTGQVTGEVERLVLVLEGAMKRAELQQALGLKHRDHFRDGYLLPALAAGLVAMTVPDKPRSSRQEYRLTDKGLALRQELAGRMKP
jgi:ATP-dependent DNA helicase RecG